MNSKQAWEQAEHCIRNHPCFSTLTASTLEQLYGYLVLERAEVMDILLSPEQITQQCWLLVSGELLRLSESDYQRQGQDFSASIQQCLIEGCGDYYHSGDFVALEELGTDKAVECYLIVASDEALLLGFPALDLRLFFQKVPSILRRLRPEVDQESRLLAGWPPALWDYFYRNRHQSKLSYKPTCFHAYSSWQPLCALLIILLLMVLLLPKAWIFWSRYPLWLLTFLIISFGIKMRYDNEIILSERTLILSQSRCLGWRHQIHAYPLALIENLRVRHWLLLPFLPSLGSISFTIDNQKISINSIDTPHKLFHAIDRLQRQKPKQQSHNRQIFTRPQAKAKAIYRSLSLSKSYRLFAMLSLPIFALPILITIYFQPGQLWLFTTSVTSVLLFLSLGMVWRRFIWIVDNVSCSCYDRSDKGNTPWKVVRISEIKELHVDTSWLGVLLKYGTVKIICTNRTEKIRLISNPYLMLEKLELLRRSK